MTKNKPAFERLALPEAPREVELAVIGRNRGWLIGKLYKIANTGQGVEPDHWAFRCMARTVAREILDRISSSPQRPKMTEARPLKWRKPQDVGSDFGHENSLFIADGIGGKYAISESAAQFLLWWPYDEFQFEEHPSVDAAKKSAEAHWQRNIAAILRAANGEGK